MAGISTPALNPSTGTIQSVDLTQVGGDSFSLGQQLAASSLPIVLTAAQMAALAPTAAITNYALETGGNLASIKSNTDKIPALGQALAAASVPVVLTAAQLSTLTPLSTVAVTQSTSPWVISGTVTANAGTNLNTSLLALESGGNLAAIAASASVLDDWDESDRAKVNPIVGQAGVAGGTGLDGATVQRVSLATNVSLPAGTNAIGKLSANSGVDIGDVTIDNGAGAAAVNIQDGGNSITVDGTVAFSNSTIAVTNTGTFATQSAITAASGSISSGAFSSGSIASGAIASGAIAAGAIASGAAVSGSFNDGAIVTLGTKTDARSTATDATSVTMMQVLKEISFMEQNPAAVAVTQSTSPWIVAGGGTAGSAATGVVTIQGIASMTAVQVSQATAGNLNMTEASAATIATNTGNSATSLAILDDWDESDRAKVNPIVGQAGVAAGVGTTGATVQRVVVANDTGRTLVSKGGSASSAGDNTLVVAGTNRLKVYAFSLSTVSTTAVTCIFQSGASGTELWRVILQTPASVGSGANLVVQPPAWLFATAAATLLNLSLSAAVAVNWSVAYFDES